MSQSGICIVSTVRAPARELARFVSHHLRLGVAEVFLFFDDPRAEAIDCFLDEQRLTCVRCDQSYWEGIDPTSQPIEVRQRANANRALQWARERGHEWIVHIDCDELVDCKGSLENHLQGYNSFAKVRFEVLEAVPPELHCASIFEANLFRRRANRLQKHLAKLLGVGSALFCGNYFRGHTMSKIAARITDELESLDIHDATYRNAACRTVNSRKIRLLHFDCVGLEAWKTKWIRRIDGTGTPNSIGPSRRMQLELFREAYESDESQVLETLYERLHLLTSYERTILRGLGMTKSIGNDWLSP